ncbi:MAG: histidine phosphatase family protein [Xanthobacteraceae bacterium]
MRCLILMRHAKAVPADGTIRDRDRPLAPRGRKNAPVMAAYLVHHGVAPDRAIVSTSKRTRETWEFAATAFRKPPAAVFEDRLYEATPQTILDVIKHAGGAAQKLLLIGHNPGLHELAMLLIAAGDVDARERLHEALPTSGLVIIEFPIEDWEKLHPRSGRLEHFVTPKSLKEPTD